jgi:hypothetical protein
MIIRDPPFPGKLGIMFLILTEVLSDHYYEYATGKSLFFRDPETDPIELQKASFSNGEKIQPCPFLGLYITPTNHS